MADLPENFVCFDLDGKSPWVFDPETQKYSRYTPDGQPDKAGTVNARLAGRDIPDAPTLWERRKRELEIAKANGVNITTAEIARAKPSAAVFALWEHWQGVQNAERNA